MGNCFVLCRIGTASRIVAEDVQTQGKVVKVVKMDGYVIEFKAPMLVKDVLSDFSGSAGIGVSKHLASSEHLPSDYELKLGNVYYMVPLLVSVTENKRTISATTRRIKMVITKQQLQELLTNQVLVQKLISVSGPKIRPCNSGDSFTNWKPKLQVIHEGSERKAHKRLNRNV